MNSWAAYAMYGNVSKRNTCIFDDSMTTIINQIPNIFFSIKSLLDRFSTSWHVIQETREKCEIHTWWINGTEKQTLMYSLSTIKEISVTVLEHGSISVLNGISWGLKTLYYKYCPLLTEGVLIIEIRSTDQIYWHIRRERNCSQMSTK